MIVGRINGHRILKQTIEQFPPISRCAAVKAKRVLVKVVTKMLMADGHPDAFRSAKESSGQAIEVSLSQASCSDQQGKVILE
jgi:hypothetical protein